MARYRASGQPWCAVSCNLANPSHLDIGDDSECFARWFRAQPHLPAPACWWMLFPELGLAVELEDQVGVRWEGHEVAHCTAVPHGVAEGDELHSLFFGSQAKAAGTEARKADLAAAIEARRGARVAVGDAVWVKWFHSDDDRKHGRFRRVSGTVREVGLPRGEVEVCVKLTAWAVARVSWMHVVHAGAVAPARSGSEVAGGLVGQRVRVYWPAEDHLYAGRVTSWDAGAGEHTVCYDDGETHRERLGGEEAPYWAVV